MRKNRIFSLLLGLSGCFLMALAPARPATAGEVHTRKVFYADLDVASPEGAAVLMRRITAVSRKLCGPEPDLRNLEASKRFNTCVAGSVQRAAAQIHTPRLAALPAEDRR